MRKILTILAVMALLIPAWGEASAEKKKKGDQGFAQIEFAEKVYDFGTIKEKGGIVEHDFEFVNNGDGNLMIISATAECGCTKPTFPQKAIAPGKKNKIHVAYNPLGRPGSFDKVVTVVSNGKPRKVRLKIRGTVIPDK